MNAVVRNTLAGMLLLAVVLPAQAQEERSPGEFFSDCPECPEMVVVPAGSFTMGTFEGQAFQEPDNKPAHRVTIESPFAVGVFEVTFAEWDACVRAGGCEDLSAGRRRVGSGPLSRNPRELGGRAGVCAVVVPEDRPRVPVVERGGMGVCGACRYPEACMVLREETVETVPVRGRAQLSFRLPGLWNRAGGYG